MDHTGASVQLLTKDGIEPALVTGVDGCASIADDSLFMHDEPCYVQVEHENYATARFLLRERNKTVVRLFPTARFVGRMVTANTWRPIANARVVRHDVLTRESLSPESVSADSGVFSIESVPLGAEFLIRIMRKSFLEEIRTVRCSADGTPVDIPLSDGCELSGRVVDVQTGRGLGQAHLWPEADAAVDEDGRFVLLGLTGTPSIVFSAPNYCRTVATVPVSEGRATEVLIPMIRSESLRLRPLGIAVRKNSDVRIRMEELVAPSIALSSAYPGFAWENFVVQDDISWRKAAEDDGIVDVSGFRPWLGLARIYMRSSESNAEAARDIDPVARRRGDVIDFDFGALGSIVGSALPFSPGLRVNWNAGEAAGSVTVAGDGTFRMNGTGVGLVRVELTINGQRIQAKDVQVDDMVKSARCEFDVHDCMLELRGVVVNEFGDPVPSVTVGYGAGTSIDEVDTDERGMFALWTHASRPTVALEYKNKPNLVYERSVTAPAQALRLVLPESVVVRLSVVHGTTGLPVLNVRSSWTMLQADGEVKAASWTRLLVDSDGVAEVVVPRGRVTIRLKNEAGDLDEVVQTIEAMSSSENVLRIVMMPSAGLR